MNATVLEPGFYIGIVLLLSSFGFGNDSGAARKNEELVKQFIENWSNQNVDALSNLFDEDCQYEIINEGQTLTTRQQIAAYAQSTFAGIPDSKITPVKIFANDSTGVVEWIWTGTNTVGWSQMGIPASNKKFKVRGISIMEFENGFIKRNRDYWDWNTFFKAISN